MRNAPCVAAAGASPRAARSGRRSGHRTKRPDGQAPTLRHPRSRCPEADAPRSDARGADALEADLLGLVEEARHQASQDPFRNPVLTVALAISRRFDRGEIGEDDLAGLFVRLRAEALEARAARLRAYLGLGSEPDSSAAIEAVAEAALGDPEMAFETARTRVERTRFAAVFTAHPTFGMPKAVAKLLAEAASEPDPAARHPRSRRRPRSRPGPTRSSPSTTSSTRPGTPSSTAGPPSTG